MARMAMLESTIRMEPRIWRAASGSLDSDALAGAMDLLREGQVLLVPTETVYGLAADPWNPASIRRILEIKGRDEGRGLPLQFATPRSIESVLATAPAEPVRRLIDRFWPGPLTLLFEPRSGIPDSVCGESGAVGIRVPDHPVMRLLLRTWSGPLVVTSANPSGEPPATTVRQALDRLKGGVAGAVDAGPCFHGAASTVIDVRASPYRLIRQGSLPLDAIEAVIGVLQQHD